MSTLTPKKRGRPAKQTTNFSMPQKILKSSAVIVSEYTIELNLNGTVTSSTGPTALQALQGLERPLKIVTKGIVTVRHGEKVKQLFFMPPALKRMFYPLAQITYAKMLGMNI